MEFSESAVERRLVELFLVVREGEVIVYDQRFHHGTVAAAERNPETEDTQSDTANRPSKTAFS